VYSEEEYLNGAGLELATADDWSMEVEPAPESADERPVAVEPGSGSARDWPAEAEPAGEWAMEGGSAETGLSDAPTDEYSYGGFVQPENVQPEKKDVRERRLRRMAGVAVLAGAVGAVGGVVAANSSRAHRGAGRRSGSLVAATRSSSVVPSPVLAGSRAASSGPAVTPPARTTRSHRSHVARIRRRYTVASIHLRAGRSYTHPLTDTHPTENVRRESGAGPTPAGVGVQGSGSVAIAVDDSAGSSAPASTTAGSSVVEFGFER
jgi:hypothetical protein